MDGLEIAVLVAIVAVIVLAVSSARGRGRSDKGDQYPWWTLGLFAVGSRADEEAREARDDARLAGEDARLAGEDAPDAPDAHAEPGDGTGLNDDGDEGSEAR